VRFVGVIVGAAVVVAALLVLRLAHHHGTGGADDTPDTVPVQWQRAVVAADQLPGRDGIRITQVAVTGDGGLLDLRFEVVDPHLAEAVHAPATPPGVVDERSGLVVHNLLMSHSHTGAFVQGETYYFIFENPGNWIQRGSQVSVLLGNAEVRHVTVS
jgi:hypothetical protein